MRSTRAVRNFHFTKGYVEDATPRLLQIKMKIAMTIAMQVYEGLRLWMHGFNNQNHRQNVSSQLNSRNETKLKQHLQKNAKN